MSGPAPDPGRRGARILLWLFGSAVAGLALLSFRRAPVGPITVTASELSHAYEFDDAGARRRYEAGPLLARGTIASIVPDGGDGPFLVLDGGSKSYRPHVWLTRASQAKVAGLGVGQHVTVHCGSVSDFLDNPVLKDCTLL